MDGQAAQRVLGLARNRKAEGWLDSGAASVPRQLAECLVMQHPCSPSLSSHDFLCSVSLEVSFMLPVT